jgi:hypothetical protein
MLLTPPATRSSRGVSVHRLQIYAIVIDMLARRASSLTLVLLILVLLRRGPHSSAISAPISNCQKSASFATPHLMPAHTAPPP